MPVAPAEIPAAELARELEEFFAEHPQAALLEDGRVLFDMQSARYSLSAEQGRCLLHLRRSATSSARSSACRHAKTH